MLETMIIEELQFLFVLISGINKSIYIYILLMITYRTNVECRNLLYPMSTFAEGGRTLHDINYPLYLNVLRQSVIYICSRYINYSFAPIMKRNVSQLRLYDTILNKTGKKSSILDAQITQYLQIFYFSPIFRGIALRYRFVIKNRSVIYSNTVHSCYPSRSIFNKHVPINISLLPILCVS